MTTPGVFGYSYQEADFISVETDVNSDDQPVYRLTSSKLFDRTDEYMKPSAPPITYEIEDTPGCPNQSIHTEYDKLIAFFQREITSTKCYYCCGEMHSFEDKTFYPPSTKKTEDSVVIYNGSAAPYRENKTTFSQHVLGCHYCGWWKMPIRHTSYRFMHNSERGERRYGWNAGSNGLEENVTLDLLAYGIMKTFDVSGYDASIDDLRQWFARHPEHIYHVDPFRFETIISDCFKDRLGKNRVTQVGGRKDRGIDIILLDGQNDRILVQIKRRTKMDAVESVDVVRQLNGVLLRESVPCGMVVTTARRFSPSAVEESKIVSDGIFARHRVDLLAFDQVKDLIASTSGNNDQPWLNDDEAFTKRFHWINRIRKRHLPEPGAPF